MRRPFPDGRPSSIRDFMAFEEHGDNRWLQAADEIELEIEGIGILRNRIV